MFEKDEQVAWCDAFSTFGLQIYKWISLLIMKTVCFDLLVPSVFQRFRIERVATEHELVELSISESISDLISQLANP